MLPDARAAGSLPFLMVDRAATAEEIAKEFGRVSAMAKGRAATFYRRSGGLILAEKAIDERLSEVLEGFEGYLRTHLGGYDGLPDGAKLALLDMVYNLGPGRLFQEYPKLLAAVAKGDWAKAAGACLRRGPGAARNVWTKSSFWRRRSGSASRRRRRWRRVPPVPKVSGDGSRCSWERERRCWPSSPCQPGQCLHGRGLSLEGWMRAGWSL